MNIESIITALQGKKIGATSLKEKEAALGQMLANAYKMKRKSVNADELAIEVSALENTLSHSFAHITLAEVTLAIEAGVAGEFGSNQVNPANILAWVTAYNKCVERASALETLARRQSARDAAMAQVIDKEEEDRRNAECYKEQPGRAFNCYKAEGRAGILFPQYISHCVYKPLRNAIKGWMDTLPNRAEVLAAFKHQAVLALRNQFKRQWQVSGENAPAFDDCYKAEIVYGYFDYLISKGATI